jgi:acylphosphatase
MPRGAMPEPPDLARLHILVKGRVQNVGFRAHVEYSARQLDLTGWVRNVGYDTVEAVAEGERQQLRKLAEAIQTGPRGARVDESTVDWQVLTGEFTYFIVRRSL